MYEMKKPSITAYTGARNGAVCGLNIIISDTINPAIAEIVIYEGFIVFVLKI